MTARAPAAFTLIEILISVALAMTIVAITVVCLRQVLATSRRTQAETNLHTQASAMHQALEARLGAIFHGSYCRIRVQGAGTRDATVTLDVMGALSDIAPDLGRLAQQPVHFNELVWHRVQWSAGGGVRFPSISTGYSEASWYVNSTASQQVALANAGWSWLEEAAGAPVEDLRRDGTALSTANPRLRVRVGPQVRRDRRRDMDDNDLRLLRNIPTALHPAGLSAIGWDANVGSAALGDDDRLAGRLSVVADRVSRFRIEIIDFRGYRTVVNPTPGAYAGATPSGISYWDATADGGVQLTPPTPTGSNVPAVWTAAERVVDGVWTDGRNAAGADLHASTPYVTDYGGGTLPTPARERPALIRIAFVLNEPLTHRAVPRQVDASTAADGSPLKDVDFLEYDRRRPMGNDYVSREFSFSFTTSSLGVEVP